MSKTRAQRKDELKILSNAQRKVLRLAWRNDGYAEAGINQIGGCLHSIHPRTMDALVRRGMAEFKFGSEGGYAMMLTAEGMERGSNEHDQR